MRAIGGVLVWTVSAWTCDLRWHYECVICVCAHIWDWRYGCVSLYLEIFGAFQQKWHTGSVTNVFKYSLTATLYIHLHHSKSRGDKLNLSQLRPYPIYFRKGLSVLAVTHIHAAFQCVFDQDIVLCLHLSLFYKLKPDCPFIRTNSHCGFLWW